MKKKLVLINGTMGVGKSTLTNAVLKQLPNAVWLDGDWCWMMNPWVFSEENKRMVEDNITHLLRNFLKNPGFDTILFTWVMHRPEIFDIVLDPLQDLEFDLQKISIMCAPDELKNRMIQDNRPSQTIENSLNRLPQYQTLDTIKLDTTTHTFDQNVDALRALIT